LVLEVDRADVPHAGQIDLAGGHRVLGADAALALGAQHHVDALLQGNDETGHAGIGERQICRAFRDQLAEEWDDAAARTDHMPLISGSR